MLRQLEFLKGYKLIAGDGEVGKIKDFYFDDEKWTVRHIVVDTGGWLSGRDVLISPFAIEGIDTEGEAIRVSSTRDQIERAPGVTVDEPVSRQFEKRYYDYYGWPYYWDGQLAWGIWGSPAADPEGAKPRDMQHAEHRRRRVEDPNLRSFNKVNGYRVEATDGGMGDIEDMILDDQTWKIRYLVVDTEKILPAKDVLVDPDSAKEISWEFSTVYLDLTREDLKSRPAFKSIDDIAEAAGTEVVVDRSR